MWNFTAADTITSCYLAAKDKTVGSAAESTAVRKELKYIELSYRYHFFSNLYMHNFRIVKFLFGIIYARLNLTNASLYKS